MGGSADVVVGAELRLSSQELGLYAADGLDVAATNLTIRARPANTLSRPALCGAHS